MRELGKIGKKRKERNKLKDVMAISQFTMQHIICFWSFVCFFTAVQSLFLLCISVFSVFAKNIRLPIFPVIPEL